MPVYINAIGTSVPKNKIPQAKIADFMGQFLDLNDEERKELEILYRATGIKHRHSVIEDYGKARQDFDFFPDDASDNEFPGTSDRMKIYEQEAVKLAEEATLKIKESLGNVAEITHLITVSCTGMYAPGLDIDLIRQLGLRTTIQRTAINFMGCYGAFNGLKVANSICTADPSAKVLVVSVELCTLHFQRTKDKDTLLANALFSDGAGAAIVSCQPSKEAFLIKGFHSDLATDGINEMAWRIGNQGFEMKLSTLVPEIIEQHILKLTNTLLARFRLELSEIDLFAIHPGGKKILEVIENKLDIIREKNKYAFDILKDYGNMSSATILFVLNYMMEQNSFSDAKKVLSFAFGPGLTIESMLLETIHHD